MGLLSKSTRIQPHHNLQVKKQNPEIKIHEDEEKVGIQARKIWRKSEERRVGRDHLFLV